MMLLRRVYWLPELYWLTSGKRRALIPPSLGYTSGTLQPIPEEVHFLLFFLSVSFDALSLDLTMVMLVLHVNTNPLSVCTWHVAYPSHYVAVWSSAKPFVPCEGAFSFRSPALESSLSNLFWDFQDLNLTFNMELMDALDAVLISSLWQNTILLEHIILSKMFYFFHFPWLPLLPQYILVYPSSIACQIKWYSSVADISFCSCNLWPLAREWWIYNNEWVKASWKQLHVLNILRDHKREDNWISSYFFPIYDMSLHYDNDQHGHDVRSGVF